MNKEEKLTDEMSDDLADKMLDQVCELIDTFLKSGGNKKSIDDVYPFLLTVLNMALGKVLMVVDSLKKTLNNPPEIMRTEKTQKCVQFASEMKKMGLVKHSSPASQSPENSLEQLKLLAYIQLPKRQL